MSLPFHSARASSVREASRFFTGPRRLELARSFARSRRGRGARAFAAASIAAAVLALSAAAASAQQCASGALNPAVHDWASPLDRLVSLRAPDMSLRDALDRVAVASGIKLSYASEAIPLDNRVCAAFDSIALGNALSLLLRGTDVLPLSAGDDHVVLIGQSGSRNDEASRAPRILDKVVVTGGAVESPARPLTVAMNVVTGAQLSRYAGGNLMQALSDVVPGLWLWQSAPTSLIAHYGSIRGSSSFGSSYPKVYVDGIELANPLLMTQFTPETVERIEVIRGPQGAALYGSDAISGVINIVTHHEGIDDGGRRATFQSGLGMSQTSFASHSSLVQDHAFTL